MKLSDICVLAKIKDNRITILYCGKYSECAKRRNKDNDMSELIMRQNDSVNISGLSAE
jgi:hypothetical protein